jgi:hypothetical protein
MTGMKSYFCHDCDILESDARDRDTSSSGIAEETCDSLSINGMRWVEWALPWNIERNKLRRQTWQNLSQAMLG